jgi:hypothetical protein
MVKATWVALAPRNSFHDKKSAENIRADFTTDSRNFVAIGEVAFSNLFLPLKLQLATQHVHLELVL